MNELIFSLKAFAAACFIIFVLQFKVGGVTLEDRTEHWLQTSEASNQLRQVAEGGLRLMSEATDQTLKWMGLRAPTPTSGANKATGSNRNSNPKEETQE